MAPPTLAVLLPPPPAQKASACPGSSNGQSPIAPLLEDPSSSPPPIFSSAKPPANFCHPLRATQNSLFKFPQMDFELTIWEMSTLLHSPKTVFRSFIHHRQTHHRYHRADPSFTYVLALFLVLTGLAWGIAYTSSVGATVRLTLLFVFVHFLLGSVCMAALAWVGLEKLLGPRGLVGQWRGRRGRRGRGLFPQEDGGEGQGGGKEGLEFGYCFDVAIRAFFPVWVMIYVIQFLLWPLISKTNWISLFFGNTLYLVAVGYYTVITFLGYNALPSLQHTEVLLSPAVAFGIIWFISLFSFNMPRVIGPLLLLGAR